MKITPNPTLTVMKFTPEDKLYRVHVGDEKVIDFSASSRWIITNVGITKDYRELTLTVEKREENESS